MKKFTINCDFGGQMSPFAIYIGKPEGAHHPLHFQADWLSKARGGMIPGEVMEAVTQLQELAEKNGVALEELCVYALGTEEQQAALEASAVTPEKDLSDEPGMEDEDLVDKGDHTRHETDSHGSHTVEDEVEDMASEGGQVEEDAPEIHNDDEKK